MGQIKNKILTQYYDIADFQKKQLEVSFIDRLYECDMKIKELQEEKSNILKAFDPKSAWSQTN